MDKKTLCERKKFAEMVTRKDAWLSEMSIVEVPKMVEASIAYGA